MHFTDQERYKMDREWKRKIHGKDLSDPSVEVSWHNQKTGKYLSDIVFASNDGIITTFAVVAGVAGAGLTSAVVIVLGIANLLADGASMGLGNYLGRKSEKGFIRQLRKKEAWEIENIPKKEKQEIRDIFINKGFQGADLDRAVDIITSNKQVWIDTMLKDELGVIDDENSIPHSHGIVTFFSFTIAGSLPLLPYLIPNLENLFRWSIITTFLSLYVIGALRYKLADSKWWIAGFEMMLVGGIAAVIAYVVGLLLSSII